MIIDHLGTPIAAHNAKGEAVWTAKYEAWGRIRNEIVSDGLKVHVLFSIMMKRTGCTTTVLLLQPKECWMKLKKKRGFNNKGFVEKRLGGYKQKGRLKNLSDGLLLLNFVSDCTTRRSRN
ncbi:hypothetical protein CYJ99_09680 [Neisseria perflava]|uniref:RHS domain-containing protein n=1 Tax=Neisseria perflava TaxID=33053 RepID=A0A9X7I547_NEIPE|nr:MULTISPECIES: RHS domain-containing protein [Neisseria]MBF1277586.1 RHS domain-containing protein [Neisseria sp.]PLA49243.1 hypothetical protein CYJ99_09680 [Neisseria perflava]WOS98732.1 RHS domain-containing protein [Neisseria perflava]